MSFETALGLVAGALVAISFLPQLIKVWKTKKVRDISLAMFIIIIIGNILWLIYGFMINSLPVILTNALIFVFASTITYFKIKYKQ